MVERSGHDGLDAVAPFTGPFPHVAFIEAVERAAPTGKRLESVTQDGAAYLTINDGHLRFAGAGNLTDYHSPLGPGAKDAISDAIHGSDATSFSFDSMPKEALVVVEDAVRSVGTTHTTTQTNQTAVLHLPDSLDDWLMSIGKKERHEVRRKRRRFEAEFGTVEIVRSGAEAIGMFCDMHRTSAGSKGDFMTSGMEAYFLDLINTVGAVIHRLVCDGTTRATAFGFETADAYYFYNTAYDPDAAMASPGVVLFSAMIEHEISRGAKVFDFLKGDERYKYRHGAVARPLYAVEGSLS